MGSCPNLSRVGVTGTRGTRSRFRNYFCTVRGEERIISCSPSCVFLTTMRWGPKNWVELEEQRIWVRIPEYPLRKGDDSSFCTNKGHTLEATSKWKFGSQNGSVEVPGQEQAMFGCYFCFEDRFMTSDSHLSQLEAGAPII